MRFLSVGPRFCLQLPPDPASRQRPCSWLAIWNSRSELYSQWTFTTKSMPMQGKQDKGDDACCDISHMISDARQRLAIILLTILSPTTWMISTMTSMTMTAATR